MLERVHLQEENNFQVLQLAPNIRHVSGHYPLVSDAVIQ